MYACKIGKLGKWDGQMIHVRKVYVGVLRVASSLMHFKNYFLFIEVNAFDLPGQRDTPTCILLRSAFPS